MSSEEKVNPLYDDQRRYYTHIANRLWESSVYSGRALFPGENSSVESLVNPITHRTQVSYEEDLERNEMAMATSESDTAPIKVNKVEASEARATALSITAKKSSNVRRDPQTGRWLPSSVKTSKKVQFEDERESFDDMMGFDIDGEMNLQPGSEESPMTRPKITSSDIPPTGPRPSDQNLIPSFSPETFSIYNSPWMPPTDFTNLHPAHNIYKEKLDMGILPDDGSDEWGAFNSDPMVYAGMHPGEAPFTTMCYAIGRIFVNRARRAKRAGTSFHLFEKEESLITLERNRRQGKEEGKLARNGRTRMKTLQETTLSDDVRLAVFVALRGRLCEEVWGEVHPEGPMGKAKQMKEEAEEEMARKQEARKLSKISKGKRKMEGK